MKTAVSYRTSHTKQPHFRYPNAATRRAILDKLMDLMVTAAIGAAAAAALLFVCALA